MFPLSCVGTAQRLPFFYNDVTEPIIAVARGSGPAHVHDEDQLVFICSFHEDAHEEDVPGAEDHLSLPVRMPVRGVLI